MYFGKCRTIRAEVFATLPESLRMKGRANGKGGSRRCRLRPLFVGLVLHFAGGVLGRLRGLCCLCVLVRVAVVDAVGSGGPNVVPADDPPIAQCIAEELASGAVPRGH